MLCVIDCILPQTDHPGGVSAVSDWDAGLRLHSQPGSSVGGIYHRWNLRVGNHKTMATTMVINITGRA